MPSQLEAIRERFRQEPELQEQLREIFASISELPGGNEGVFPWWRALDDSDEMVGPYERFADYFYERYPQRHQTLRRRDMAWAGKAQGHVWADYFYGLIRRDPELGQVYYEWDAALRAIPELKRAVHTAWDQEFGPPGPWPPPDGPPQLPSTQPGAGLDVSVPKRPSLDRPTLERPERPRLPGPIKPTGPQRPTRPERTTP